MASDAETTHWPMWQARSWPDNDSFGYGSAAAAATAHPAQGAQRGIEGPGL